MKYKDLKSKGNGSVSKGIVKVTTSKAANNATKKIVNAQYKTVAQKLKFGGGANAKTKNTKNI